jgi:hypothetical protein
MTLVSEDQLISVWNLMLTFLKTTYLFTGFSLFLAIQYMMWATATGFLVWHFFGGMLGGGGGNDAE